MPTRFRYQRVAKDSFGLSLKEILKAEDAQLNEYISLKRLAPFRDTERLDPFWKKWKKYQWKKRNDLRINLNKKPWTKTTTAPTSTLPPPERASHVDDSLKNAAESTTASSHVGKRKKRKLLDASRASAYGIQ